MKLTEVFSSASLSKRDIGNKGEDLAVRYIKKQGYKIIERNFSVPGVGEIDIVARDGEYLCFVEVRLRSGTAYTPAQTVDDKKQKKLSRTAQIYLMKNGLDQSPVRFDVAEVYGRANNARVELIKDAFWTK